MPTTIWGAIDTQLTTDAALNVLLDGAAETRVNFARKPDPLAIPYVTYWTPGGSIDQWYAPAVPGTPYIENVQIQVDVYDNDPERIDAIVLRIAALLDFASLGAFNSVLLAMTRTSSLEEKILEDEPDESGKDIWHVPLLYEALIQKSL